jgi:hypothetical protein
MAGMFNEKITFLENTQKTIFVNSSLSSIPLGNLPV